MVALSFPVPPSFTSKPGNQNVKEGDETEFLCTATGNPNPTITWLKDGKTVASGDSFKFTASRNQSGKYWCSAENGLDVYINTSVYLDVQCKWNIFSTAQSTTVQPSVATSLISDHYSSATSFPKN